MNYKLSPSDMTFLLDGCERCFYLKVKNNIPQPSIPLPSIFSKIAGLLKNHFQGKRTDLLHPSLPPGIIKYGERWIESDALTMQNHNDKCYIKGRFDIVIEFDNNTYGVVDFKTGSPDSSSSKLYARQLNAYAYALEHPALGALRLSPVSKLALLYFHPTKVSQQNEGWLSFDAEITLIDIEKDEKGFINFIDQVLTILESPNPPAPSETCQWCNYIKRFQS